MSSVVPVPGRVVALVLGTDETASGALRALDLPQASITAVRTVTGPLGDQPWGPGDAPDYLVVARAGVTIEPTLVETALELLRSDASTGLVGWSPAGRARGGLALAIDLDLCVVRPEALDAARGFDHVADGALAALDLGWRMWLSGWRVRSAGPTSGPPSGRDPLAADAVLSRLLRDGPRRLEPGVGRHRADGGGRELGRTRRTAVQARRRRGDGELVPFAHREVAAWAEHDPAAVPLLEGLERWGAPDRRGRRRRIAVVTADTLAPRMAGPGIRAREIARVLSAEHEVVLATTGRGDLTGEAFEVRAVGERGLRALERWCDVLVFQGWVLAGRPFLRDSDKVLVADLYDPMHLEALEQGRDAPGERGWFDAVRNVTVVLNEQLERADFVLCASPKQRDLWLGQLAGLGRVNPVVYGGDETLDQLLAVVPFGVTDAPPTRTRAAIRGAIPGIRDEDAVVLWGGGIYNWFDPLTLLRAVDRVRADVPGIRLVFLGLRHPNPDIPEMEMAVATRRLAEELALVGTHVFFNEDWIEFDDRQNFLLDADLGVSTHLHHIETEFSFRTRILDYLWAGLPILATDGDGFADLIHAEGLGLVVPPGDVDAVADALRRLLTDRELAAACRADAAALAPTLRWSRALEPLVTFCRDPKRAADIACPDVDPHAGTDPVGRGWRQDLATARSYLKVGGVRLVWDRAAARVRRQRS